MKFKTRVREVEAVRWDGPSHGFWNGVCGEQLALTQPDGTRTWLGDAVSKPEDEPGAVWFDGAILYVKGYDEAGEYPGPWDAKVEPGMWLVWSRGTIYAYTQEVFDRMYEAA